MPLIFHQSEEFVLPVSAGLSLTPGPLHMLFFWQAHSSPRLFPRQLLVIFQASEDTFLFPRKPAPIYILLSCGSSLFNVSFAFLLSWKDGALHEGQDLRPWSVGLPCLPPALCVDCLRAHQWPAMILICHIYRLSPCCLNRFYFINRFVEMWSHNKLHTLQV